MDALPRQQTLRATVDWSYNLLSQEERLLLQRLAVFTGGCMLEAAETVCGGAGLEADQVLDRLAALVDKSMVLADRQVDEETRYHLPGIIRQYAAERLEEAGESERLHRCHRDYYLQEAETGSPRLWTKERPAWVKRFEADHDNFRQAWSGPSAIRRTLKPGPGLWLPWLLFGMIAIHMNGENGLET